MSQPKIAEKVSLKAAVQQILQRFKETGSFSTSDLYRIKNTVTKQKYHSILQRRAIPSGLKLCGRGGSIHQLTGSIHQDNLFAQQDGNCW